jgi:hypothetical protein
MKYYKILLLKNSQSWPSSWNWKLIPPNLCRLFQVQQHFGGQPIILLRPGSRSALWAAPALARPHASLLHSGPPARLRPATLPPQVLLRAAAVPFALRLLTLQSVWRRRGCFWRGAGEPGPSRLDHPWAKEFRRTIRAAVAELLPLFFRAGWQAQLGLQHASPPEFHHFRLPESGPVLGGVYVSVLDLFLCLSYYFSFFSVSFLFIFWK